MEGEGLFAYTIAHADWLASSGSIVHGRSLAFAAGVNAWACTLKAKGARLPLNRAHIPCMCDMHDASFPHLMWCCDATQARRDDALIALPLDRCEERLLARIIPPTPAPRQRGDAPPIDNVLLGLVEGGTTQAARLQATLVIATDGGAAAERSSWSMAIGLAEDMHPKRHGGIVTGEDNTPFTAEAEALLQTLLALDACRRSRSSALFPDVIVVIVDCKGLIDLVHRTRHPAERFAFWQLLANVYRDLRQATTFHFVWTPSHGKRPDWTAPPGCPVNTDVCRRFNDAADLAATDALRRAQAALRQYRLQQTDALAWSSKALNLAAVISDDYTAWLRDNWIVTPAPLGDASQLITMA